MIQLTPQMRLLLAVEPVDFRKGIDGLVQVCRQRPNLDPNGGRLGDMFMSLIHTCRLCATNPLEYLNALQHHAKEALEHPNRWLPWNYEQALPPFDTG